MNGPKQKSLDVFKKIQLLALDFDGVMTDDRVLVNETGKEAVWCKRGDGMGIARVKAAGIPVVVISTEKNPVVAARCRKLDIPCYHGREDKLATLKQVASEMALGSDAIAFVGNDINDLECLEWVGLSIVVNDAFEEVKIISDIITDKNGGYGAVREVCDLLVHSRSS
jgi:YrbI family 3-deoxy-D-manno-octulosonate 8-phosphate phosphatase